MKKLFVTSIVLLTLSVCGQTQSGSTALSGRTALSPLPALASGTITVTADGSYNAFPGFVRSGSNFVVAYRKGTAHAEERGTIVRKISTDQGATWGSESTVASDGTYDLRDASLVKLANGDILIFWGIQLPGPPPVNQVDAGRVQRSTDNGVTWGSPVQIDSNFTGFSFPSNPAIQLSNGHLLLPLMGKNTSDTRWSAHLMKSTDNGVTWGSEVTIASGPTDGRSYEEPRLLLLPSGNIFCMIRTAGGTFYKTTSTDSGATWSTATSAFNASGNPRMALFTSGRIAIFYRSTVSDGRIAVRSSTDNGATWSAQASIEPNHFFMTYASAFEYQPGQLALTWSMERTVNQTFPAAAPADVFFRYFSEAEISPTAASATISGQITRPDGSPLAGATLQLSGARPATTITNSSGVYHFDNIDTDNFYTVTPSLANYSFAPASRSFSLVGNKTDAVFTANPDLSVSANAADTTEYFVRQQYLDFLNREPDQGGFEYWSAQISQCGSDATCIRQRRVDVSAAFFASEEFQQTGSFISGLYAGALGRTPTYDEFMADRASVVGGPNLNANRAAFADVFVQRPEFTLRYPQTMTRDQFVDALLQTMIQRSGKDLSSLRDTMLSDYDTGERSLVVRDAVLANAFAQAEYNKTFVLMEYFGYLQRGPDTGGYDFWLNVLNDVSPGNYRGMVCAFLTSTEYQRRFSIVVTHSNAECGP